MHIRLPATAQEFSDWSWAQIEPYALELAERELTAENVSEWLADWSHLLSLLEEVKARLGVACAADTSDVEAQDRSDVFQEQVYGPALVADNDIRHHLLESGLSLPGFEIPMRNMRAGASFFCEENVPLLAEEQQLISEYNRIIGSQTAEWDGDEVTLYELEARLEDPDRAVRERAWRLRVKRQLADSDAIDGIWGQLVALRHRMARNAGFDDYRALRWQQLHRFDYTPQDCLNFHRAIQKVVAPVVSRIYERYRQGLRVSSLRPWDLEVDPLGRSPLRPFSDSEELEQKAASIFRRIDPALGDHFETMRREGLLDLGNRKNKAPHAWCDTFPLVRKPFIFMNAIGWQRDVIIFLHEAGHAFHVFEMAELPYYQQLDVPAEFLEVASLAIELLAAPYLAEGKGGFYSPVDAARARIKHLEDAIIISWPYIAAMDAFQHWAYANPDAVGAGESGVKWSEIWLSFMPGVDWDGLESELEASWQSTPHFFGWPFSGIEYGIAQLGAGQVWRNALDDQAAAVARYRKALSLGGTASLPELYKAAGAKLAFDAGVLEQVVGLMEQTISNLSHEAGF